MILTALVLALQAQPAPDRPAGRITIGVHQSWGAFRDASPRKCFAIARPPGVGQRNPAFASIGVWPGSAARPQFHTRLSRTKRPDARVTLSIGERRFALIAGATDAWAPDPATDAAIVAAMRGARSMSVESVGASSRPFADTYALGGAATAIDAAVLGCARAT